jgi:hypothetical protein
MKKNRRNQIMPKKEVWLSEETLNAIRKELGIKKGDKDTGISEWIREAVCYRLLDYKNIEPNEPHIKKSLPNR